LQAVDFRGEGDQQIARYLACIIKTPNGKVELLLT